MESENPDRTCVGGVEFGPLKGALREHQYPVTTAELVELYGGFELEGPEESATVEQALGVVSVGTFRTPRDVRDALLEGVGGTAPGDSTDGADVNGDDSGDETDRDGVDVEGTDADDDWSPKSV